MIKRAILSTFFILILSCNNSKNTVLPPTKQEPAKQEPANTAKIDRIVIKYMNPGMETVARVNCDSWDLICAGSDQKTLSKSDADFKAMEKMYHLFVDDSLPYPIDVRIHIENYGQGDSIINTICMDIFGRFYSPSFGQYKRNDSLKLFILNKVDEWGYK